MNCEPETPLSRTMFDGISKKKKKRKKRTMFGIVTANVKPVRVVGFYNEK